MATPFEIKQKAAQGDLLGRNQRALRRSWEAHQACIETKKLIEKHLPGLVASPPQTDNYEAGLKSLLSAMEEKFPQFHRYRAARLFLSRGIENGNATGLWHLDLPPVLIRISRQEPLRTEGWFRKAAVVAAVMARFRDALGSLEADPLAARPDLILGAILLSAMTNGGLCDPDDVMALVPALGKAQPAAADGDTIWIDVTHRSRGHLRNDVDGEDAVTRKRWFVDPTSLGWLIRWMALVPDRRAATVEGVDRITAWALIRRVLKIITNSSADAMSLPTSLGAFARVAVHAAEASTDLDLPEALVEVAIGRTSAVSVPTWNWAMLLDTQRSYLNPVLAPDFWSYPTGKRSKPPQRYGSDRVVSVLERDIRKAINQAPKKGLKITPKMALERLHPLLVGTMPGSAGQALLSWYVRLLQENGLEVSSIRRYHAAIGKHWLSFADDFLVDTVEPGELDDVYHRAIETWITPQGKSMAVGRWRQFHDFLLARFQVPPLLGPLEGGEDGDRIVRAAIIPHGLYTAVRKAIRDASGLDGATRTTLEVLVMLAYRTGMHLGELIKLKLLDIERSEELWLFVRSNRHGDNKSISALRKIPLAVLLTANELQLLNWLISTKEAANSGSGTLLFAESAVQPVFCKLAMGVIFPDSVISSPR